MVALKSDCLDKCLLSKYSKDEVDAMFAQAGCEFVGFYPRVYVWGCEIDPGNSAAHNQSPEGITVEEDAAG